MLDTRVWKPADLNSQAAPLQSRLAYWLPETQLRVTLRYPYQVQSSQEQALYPPHRLMPMREFLTQSWHRKKKKKGSWLNQMDHESYTSLTVLWGKVEYVRKSQ